MDREEVISVLRERKLLITPDALSHVVEHTNCREIIGKAVEAPGGLFITKKRIEEIAEEIFEAQKAMQVSVVKGTTAFQPFAKEIVGSVKMDEESDVSGKSDCTGKVEDFVEYFRDRFEREASLMRQRPNPPIKCSALKGSLQKAATPGRKDAAIVGIVLDKRVTKNGHTLIELEDEEGTQPCLVPKDAEAALREMAADIVLDEVITLSGYLSNGGLFIVKEIIWPDIPFKQKRKTQDDVAIAMVSDLQIGSRYFLREQFTKFLSFLSGEGEGREIAGKVKYLAIAGDVVDGIGVYPTQEKELVAKDVYTQYEIFSEFVKNIPEYIEIIVIPGNHDAVRIAQPRPRLPREFTRYLDGYSNVHFAGDPSIAELHGLRTMLFHGDSYYSMASAIPRLRDSTTHPEKVGVELLRRRHLSPLYGENPIVPEHKDYLFINEVPDIMHFGHVHHNGYATYRGTTIINSGTWQDTTDYQLKQGHLPTPCQLPIYHCKTGEISVLNFK
ncbi:DNA-directed DNA polymerase II small subunit [Candidatus Micrarchaeota archaeon]|nr:DNA-directed DNA polymerase II small subunit [Candidatus Micrarchaeota archaeon]